MRDDDCAVCGRCWWTDCGNDADYSMDVALKRHGKPLYDGKIELCAGHTRLAHERNGRLDLNWLAVEQAVAMKLARA